MEPTQEQPQPSGNERIHPTMRAFMWFAPGPQEPQAEPIKSALPAVNEGDFTPADLAAIDAEFGFSEAELQQADSDYDRLKNSGELERRRDAEAERMQRRVSPHLYRTPSEGY